MSSSVQWKAVLERVRVTSSSALQPRSSAKLHSALLCICDWSTASSIALLSYQSIAGLMPCFMTNGLQHPLSYPSLCVCVCLCVFRCMCVNVCVDVEGKPCLCFSGIAPSFSSFLNSRFLTGLVLTKSAKLTGLQAHVVCLSLATACLDDMRAPVCQLFTRLQGTELRSSCVHGKCFAN